MAGSQFCIERAGEGGVVSEEVGWGRMSAGRKA